MATEAPIDWPDLPLADDAADAEHAEHAEHAVPADLIELFEVLEFDRAVNAPKGFAGLRSSTAPVAAGSGASAPLEGFVPRYGPGGWGARQPTGVTGISPTYGSTIHYEGPKMGSFPHSSCATKVRAIQAFHMDERGWTDIAYTSVVCPHGYIFEGRWLGRRTGANGTNVGNATAYAHCALIGAGDPASSELVNALARVCEFARRHGRAGKRCNGHRDWKPTACPGDPLYAQVKAGVFEKPGTTPTPPPPTDPEEAELMGAKDDIIAAVKAEAEAAKPYAIRLDKDGVHRDGTKLVKGTVWIVSPQGTYHIERPALNTLYASGQIKPDASGPDGPQPRAGSPEQIATLPILGA